MSEGGRRIFPMETALGVIANQAGPEINDFLSFAISRPVCECCAPAVTPIVKGWLYSLYPAFMEKAFDPENESYTLWANEQKNRLSENVSLEAMPATEVQGIHKMLDDVEAAFAAVEEKDEELEAAQEETAMARAESKSLAPFKEKAESLEKKVADLEEKVKSLQAELSEAQAEANAFKGKVPVDENEIEKAIKDILKKTIGSLSLAASAGGGADEADVAAESADAAMDSSDEVPDSFGFGASGPSDDGFGF